MPSRADVEAYAESNRNIRALILAVLRGFWSGLDHSNAIATRDALLEVVPLLVAQYGEVAASVAADFYESSRAAAGISGAFAAILADPVDLEAVRSDVRWSITPLFDRQNPDPPAALGRLQQKVDELTLQPGRDTIVRSAASDPAKPRWARVPVGETCAFCLMLASRGAVYRTEESARYKGRGRTEADKYHGKCDCTPVAVFGNDPYPEGYDPDALLQQYMDARKAAKTGLTKPILAKLREQQGLDH